MTRKCRCSWDECDSFHEKLKVLLPEDDIWNKEIIRFRFGDNLSVLTDKKRAAYSAMH